MHVWQALILGLTQGLTEFIPVSSSGHLILVGHLINAKDTGLAFDIATNIGTLAALFLVFYRDITNLLVGLFKKNEYSRLSWLMVLATIPGIVAGILLENAAETVFRSTHLVAINLIIVGFIMLLADRLARQKYSLKDINVGKGLAIGSAQALALVPGVSRSGITISAGILAGLDRVSATRFSFLLATPIIAGATAKVLLKPENLQQLTLEPVIYAVGVLAAFASGYVAIRFMLSYLSRHGLQLFAYYRIIIGLIVLAIGLK